MALDVQDSLGRIHGTPSVELCETEDFSRLVAREHQSLVDSIWTSTVVDL
jgi:hypothetical protein